MHFYSVQNGIADWIYEEEILEASRAYYWSPDGSTLAYLKFNDEDVTQFPMIKHDASKIHAKADEMIQYISYPRSVNITLSTFFVNKSCEFCKLILIFRPGEANPTVGLYFVKMDDLNTEIKVNLDVQERILKIKIFHQENRQHRCW